MSTFRIGGIASGIDFNKLIDQLMALERRPLNLLEDKKQLLSWKKDYWSEIQTALSNLDKSLEALLKKSTMMARSASSSDQTIVTADATSDAATGTYAIHVNNLATSTKVTSGGGASGLGISGKIVTSEPISSYTSRFSTNPTAGTFTINGAIFTLSDTNSDSKVDELKVTKSGYADEVISNASGLTLDDIVSGINSNANIKNMAGLDAANAISYDLNTDKLSLKAAAAGTLNLGSAGDTSNFLSAVGLLNAGFEVDNLTKTSTSHLGRVRTTQILADANFQGITSAADWAVDGSGNGKFTINGVEITYNINTDTLQKVIDRINNSTAGVSASYDSINDKLVLTNKSTGSLSISRADVTGTFLEKATYVLDSAATETIGTNASFTINGGSAITSLSNDVTGVIAGVTLHLKKDSSDATITIEKDNSKAKAAIKDFIDKYNAAITLINTRLSEEKVKEPLSDYDRKKGILRADRTLIDIKSKLVNKATSIVTGLSATMDQLAEIGITITSDDFGKSSTLVLDEAKLDAALNDNAGAVASLFFNDIDADGKVDNNEDGVAARISLFMDQVLDKGGTKSVTSYTEDDSKVTYIGSWADGAGGNTKESSTAGDSAKFTFTGSGVTWYATKDVGMGVAKVYIDGVYKQDVDLSSSSTQSMQNVYSIAGLSDGSHTIEIKVSSGTVNIDGFDVTFTNSTGVVPRLQEELQSEISYIDKQIAYKEEWYQQREDTLVKQFTAMELAIQRLQEMQNKLSMQFSSFFGG
ncbi:MAG: flagellar filament capping protein FliD [Firmicutes bacterium]|nr:flagellar filament capping protein FliD [Bacillota bacterium]